MTAVKLMFSGVMLTVNGVFLLVAGADGLAMILWIAALIVFCIGLFDSGRPPKPSPELLQIKCTRCGREFDFDYDSCPYCGEKTQR